VGALEPAEEERGDWTGARTKCTGKVHFIAAWAEGGWDGRDGLALAASARSRHVSSACTGGRGRRSERLLRRPHVEATHAWRCPLAAKGGEVDRVSEPRRATWHDGECQRTLSTRARAALDDGLHGTHSASDARPVERPARGLRHRAVGSGIRPAQR
jgi:hypothetical protein